MPSPLPVTALLACPDSAARWVGDRALELGETGTRWPQGLDWRVWQAVSGEYCEKAEPLAETAHYITLSGQNKIHETSIGDSSHALYLKYLDNKLVALKRYVSASDLHRLPFAESCLCWVQRCSK